MYKAVVSEGHSSLSKSTPNLAFEIQDAGSPKTKFDLFRNRSSSDLVGIEISRLEFEKTFGPIGPDQNKKGK